ncbi:hypothetical protein M9H77_09719 [Catharanthus roseus]|uniref:Uncharacterized protein n=1 Tax=Catharanthus roseus TaxID=4058 RepID=A0ACC0C1D7_CATRO|nr:hypothetical protein M9H77_09719 [Catharanthus roseus]
MKVSTYLIITRYLRSRTSDHRSYVTLACEGGGAIKSRTKQGVDDEEEEEEVPLKRQGPYGPKKWGFPFKLKGEQMATSENWQFAQKIYNVLAKMKKNRMHGQNTVEVLCLSAQRGYTVFYRNRVDSNIQYAIVRSRRDDSDRRHIDQNMLAKLTKMIKMKRSHRGSLMAHVTNC